MSFWLWSVIIPGVLWDCIKKGVKISVEDFNKRLGGCPIEEDVINVLNKLLNEVQEKEISSKQKLKKELKKNEEYQGLYHSRIIYSSFSLINIYFFGEKKKKEETQVKRKKANCKNKTNVCIRKLVLISIVLIAFILLCVFVKASNQDRKYWSGGISDSNNFGGGLGTYEKPYIINTPDELAELAYIVNVGIDYKNTYFKLNNDIYLNDIDNRGDIQIPNNNKVITDSNMHQWTPIGTEQHPFCGYFDGNNKTIWGLYINNDGNKSYQGLFGYCAAESRITNLSIQNVIVNVPGGNYIGGICGQMDGLLDVCFFERGWVLGEFCVGGIAGEANVVVNCGSSACIEGTYYSNGDEMINSEILSTKGCLGGIAGRCNYLINSVSYAQIYNPTYRAGALAGEVVFDMYNCVCDKTFIMFSDLNKYFAYLSENDMEFLYGDVLGVFDDQGQNKIESHCIYATENCSGIYTTFSDEKERTRFENRFSMLYANINFDNLEDSKFVRSECMIMNHDYSFSTQQYNAITGKLDYSDDYESVIELLNNNIDVYGGWFHPVVKEVLEQYGVGGGMLSLSKWIHSQRHNSPTLEGMDMDNILYISK